MDNTEETLEIPENAILRAIENLSKKFDSLEESVNNQSKRFDNVEKKFDNLEQIVNTQFEVIREGIVYNSAAFDRLEAKFYDARSDIANLRSDVKQLTVEIGRMKKESFV